ncbi:MAG TPA: response regulator [Terracidiphilus sp.]|nr:response regulator [Terracidiphilus sp.]
MNLIANRRKILVVDDEIVVADTLVLVFSTSGYECRKANSAEEAIDLIAEWRPEVAIIDVILPRLNGIELSRILAASIPDCRVVLISGYPGAMELLPQVKAPAKAPQILAKPLHPSLMLETVSKLLPCKETAFDP